MKKIYITIFIIFSVFLLTLKEKVIATPEIFPLASANSKYMIVESESTYSIAYFSPENASKENPDFNIYVGSSDVDLQPFVGKSVKIEGAFYIGQPYCLQECSRLGFEKRPVIAIRSVSEK